MTRQFGFLAALAALSVLVAGPLHARVDAAERPSDPAPANGSAVAEATPMPPATPASSHPALDAIFVVDALIASGTDAAVAIDQVASLTDADLAVLASHPAMVQVAGDNAALTRNLVIGLLVLGAIIALAAASDGGGSVMLN